MASIKDLKRMCNTYTGCGVCPLFTECGANPPGTFQDTADEIVDKWVSEHPVKTYAIDFFEKFPNAPKDSDGIPRICWKYVYGDGKYCGYGSCTECWNREMIE